MEDRSEIFKVVLLATLRSRANVLASDSDENAYNLESIGSLFAPQRRGEEIISVCGGANFEGEMGVELHRLFPFIDVVCLGEADTVFPELVRRLRAGQPVYDLGGVTLRVAGDSVTGSTPPSFISDLNCAALPGSC